MAEKRRAMRTLPEYDPDNNIGAVDRVRFCIVNNRMDELRQAELDQFERWKQIDDWLKERRYETIGENGKEMRYIEGHRKLRNLVMAVYTVSWGIAERDIENTKRFFREANDDQEYQRAAYIEWYEKHAEIAMEKGKFAAGEKLKTRAGELRKFYEAPKEEIPTDKLQAIQFIIEYNPEAVGLKTVENKEEHFARWREKKKTLSDKLNEEANDVEFTDR